MINTFKTGHMINTMLAECTDIVKDLAGNDYLFFDAAVEVRTGPHSYPFQAWAVCVTPKEELFVMDNNEEWHKLEISDAAGHLVIGSLYQRLKLMRIHYAKAS